MEFIIAYSSDESDSEISYEKKTPSLEVDYFNLQSDDEIENVIDCNTDLLCQSANLSDVSVGPILPPNFPCIESNSGSQTTSVKRRLEQIPVSATKVFLRDNSENNTNEMSTDLFQKVGTSHAKNVSEIQCCRKLDSETSTENLKNVFVPSNCPYNHAFREKNSYIPKHQVKTFHDHKSMVTALLWNLVQYSHLLLSCSLDSSLKIWSIVLPQAPKCIYEFHEDLGIKAAKWSLCGTQVIWGGFNKKTSILDVSSGKVLSSVPVNDYVSSVEVHPENPNLFLVGTKDYVFAFDQRSDNQNPIQSYYSNCQYVLDIAFMKNGAEFIASTEIVSHDCDDRTLMVWDFSSGAVLSNQIFSERYTCPCIKVAPDEKQFIAQTNGNYIAIFSTKRPYKLQNKRFMGHEVSGYSIGCDFSPDSRFLVSGDSKGGMYFYNYYNCNLIKKIEAHEDSPTVRVSWHPLLQSTVAVAFLDGLMQIWQ